VSVGTVLARRDRALGPEEQVALLTERLGDDAVLGSTEDFATFTVTVAPDRWADVVELCRDEPDLAYDMFDCLFGIDAREDGFDVVCVLYATSFGNRVALRARCPGGREAPTLPSVSHVFRGADWMERETWDMFGIEFEGHPGLAPRLLTVENFEGWPLRKDFHLTSRAVKPWPGVKEPAELDEEGNVIEREPRLGDAPGPYELDKAMAEQAKLANPLPEPATGEGEVAEADAATADLATDSGNVVAGDEEQAAELDQERARDQEVQEAAATEADQAEAASEGAVRTSDAPTDEIVAADARATADEARKKQAEARARKAEERRARAERDAAEAAGDDTSSAPVTGGTASAHGGRAERADEPGSDVDAAGDAGGSDAVRIEDEGDRDGADTDERAPDEVEGRASGRTKDEGDEEERS
jgi:NADH:ubiquinone oxidoreductase subunit C